MNCKGIGAQVSLDIMLKSFFLSIHSCRRLYHILHHSKSPHQCLKANVLPALKFASKWPWSSTYPSCEVEMISFCLPIATHETCRTILTVELGTRTSAEQHRCHGPRTESGVHIPSAHITQAVAREENGVDRIEKPQGSIKKKEVGVTWNLCPVSCTLGFRL